MLKYKEAEEDAARMLTEAHRYDTERQRASAMAILTDVQEQKKSGLLVCRCGATVSNQRLN